MAEPAVLDPMTTAALDEGWIRAVLFDHAIDDWVDLGPDPIRRQHVGQIYADHVAAAYGAWKWLCDRAGTDIDTPPAAQPAADALALETGVSHWTELMVALFTVGRAQALLFADLASTGDPVLIGDYGRRAFDRVSRDFAGHAALGYLELHRGTFVDRAAAEAHLERMLPAARALLDEPGLVARFDAAVAPLLESLGFAG
jgi:hypothetical protein